MKKWKNISGIVVLTAFLMLSFTSVVTAQNRQYDPFNCGQLSQYFDSRQTDFSNEYKQWLTSDTTRVFTDITNDLLKEGYTFERPLFNTEMFVYDRMDGGAGYFEPASFDGILGDNYDRIEIYINPDVERADSLTFKVKGKSKVKKNICDFAGEIRVENIYDVRERADDSDSSNYYLMVGNYLLKEDESQNGTGIFKGTCGVYCNIDKDNKKVCLEVDLDGADGYNNRNYVGTWQSYKTKAVKRCIWGEYRLPYTFDFDIGDGEMRVNPKYNSPEWEQWKSEFINGEEKIRWWEDAQKEGKQ